MKKKFALILAAMLLISIALCGCAQIDELKGAIASVFSKKEKTVTISVDWSEKKFDDDIDIKVYVDGELDRSKCAVVDCSVTHKDFSFTGSGTKQIRFKINNDLIYNYTVDFDNGTVK